MTEETTQTDGGDVPTLTSIPIQDISPPSPSYSYYDNTRVSSFKNCPRSYFLRHIKNWRREGTAAPLVFGSAWHEGMDVIWGLFGKKPDHEVLELASEAFLNKWKEDGYPDWDDMDVADLSRLAPRTPAVAKEMFYNYIQERREFLSEIEVIAIEKPFAVSIGLPGILYVGRLDKVFEKDGRIYVGEHKTTTAYKKDGGFRSDWLESWSPNSQVDGYLHAAHMMYGDAVKDVWIDGALVHKTVNDKFRFIPVTRMTAMLSAWLSDVQKWILAIEVETAKYEHALRIGEAEGDEYMTHFPKNTEHCFDKYGACSFIDICRYVPNPNHYSDEEPPAGYIQEKWEPFDVLGLEELGLKPETEENSDYGNSDDGEDS